MAFVCAQTNSAGGAVFIAHCGIFPPSNPPETEKIYTSPLEACAHCSRRGYPLKREKKLCLPRAETPAAEGACRKRNP